MQKKNQEIMIFGTDKELLNSTRAFISEFESNQMIRIQTSGSTGTPKIYNVEKDRFIHSAKRTCDFFNLKANDRAFLCISPKYIGGKMMIIRSIIRNMDLHIGSVNSFPFHEIKDYDFAAFVPLQIKSIIERDINYLKKIKNIIIGGGAIDQKSENILVKNEVNAFSTFGMTETLSHIALRKVGEPNFKTLEGINISTDSIGRLVIEDPKVAGNEKLITNDLVEIISPKEFIWKGRFDNVINSGGVKIIPEVVEQKLSKIIELPFFVDKLPDERLGEKVVLFIEGKIEYEHDLSSLLDKYEVPKEIFELPKFIYTETKKINRPKTKSLINLAR